MILFRFYFTSTVSVALSTGLYHLRYCHDDLYGHRNEPCALPIIADLIGVYTNRDPDQIRRQTTANANAFFQFNV